MEDGKCGFCRTGVENESICGLLHRDKLDGKAIVAHHKCMQYSAMLVQYKSDEFGGFKKQEVVKELKRGTRLNCYLCKVDKTKKHKKGATSGCSWASCRKTFHYLCVSMDPDTVAKRYRVAAGSKCVILYRVFCSKAHEELYRKNLSAEDIVGKNEVSDDDDDDDDDKPDDEDDEAKDDKKDDDENDDNRDSDHNSDEEPVNKKKKRDDRASEQDSDDEPVIKKEKTERSSPRTRQRDTSEQVEVVASMSSPEMSQAEVIRETQRQYHSLLRKHKNNNSISTLQNGDVPGLDSTGFDVTMATDHESGGSVTEDFNTSNSPSPDESDLSETSQTWHRASEGFVIVIPSKLDVADLKTICQQASVPMESCVLWPHSAINMKGLQDKHLPLVMWDITSKLRKNNTEGLVKIFQDMSVEQYECLYDFHVQCKDAESIHQMLVNTANKLNTRYKKEVCKIANISHNREKLTVMFLTLPKNVKDTSDFQTLLQIYQWNHETKAAVFGESDNAIKKEKKFLLRWLLPCLHDKIVELSRYPVDETLQSKGDRRNPSLTRQIQFQLETLSQSLLAENTVKIMVVCNVDESVVQYKSYVHKLVPSFLSENAGYECYCIIDIPRPDLFRDLHDVVPKNETRRSILPSDNNFERSTAVYSAFNPRFMPVHSLILHAPKESIHAAVTRHYDLPPVIVDDNGLVPDGGDDIYLDVDEEPEMVDQRYN